MFGKKRKIYLQEQLSFFSFLQQFWLSCHAYFIFNRGQPPDYVLKEAKHTSKFFKFIGGFHNENGEISASGRSTFQALKAEEFEAVSLHLLVLLFQ